MSTTKKPIIKIRGLSKSYLISHKDRVNTHPTLKDDLVKILRAPLRLIGAAGGMIKERFWALEDVDLDIYPGEVVALMGINGSGKSTLLKILSRITQPQAGEAWLHGKVTSLLEVGTGFHEELTGRENVYFNGSILGMSKSEIDQKFDEIVEFSEVENFLDTPVKHYSSGMRVRLAFSIAAHLNPDILLIDEVLAVGDVRFKQKSISRMREIAESGTTIVFVSHIVGHIRQICNRGVVLDKGKVVFDGDLEEGIETYLHLNRIDEAASKASKNEESLENMQEVDSGAISATVTDIKIANSKEAPNIRIDLKLENKQLDLETNLWVGMVIKNKFDKSVAPINSQFSGTEIRLSSKQPTIIYRVKVDKANLAPGTYKIALTIGDSSNNKIHIRNSDAARLEVPPYSLKHIKAKAVKKDAFNVLLDYEEELIKNA